MTDSDAPRTRLLARTIPALAGLIFCLALLAMPASSLATTPFVSPGATRLDVTEQSFGTPQTRVTVVRHSLISRAVADLDALPLYPRHGPLSCPVNVGPSYLLSFYYRGGGKELVTVASTGCEGVTRRGQRERWMLTLKHPAILTLLQRIVVDHLMGELGSSSAGAKVA